MTTPITPLLDTAGMSALRAVVDAFTAESVYERLGPIGRAAQERGDVAGALRELPSDDSVATLVRLFLLGVDVPVAQARAALGDLIADRHLFESDSEHVRARLEIRPYGDDSGAAWWVVSDFGSDVRRGPVAADHVLGIGGASVTLAQSTIRQRVDSALDIGIGCGVQSLHLSGHAARVVGTDISDRALQFAATTAALSGVEWDLRAGSLLEPVRGEQFDLVVANPPFVVSPGLAGGRGGHDYRDSGLSGDGVTQHLVTGIPSLLNPGGSASLLANWIIPPDGDWADRIGGWLVGLDCDAWVWQREVLGIGEYVSLWLRDAGHTPGTAQWDERYASWIDWFERAGIPAVGMGLITLWRSDSTEPIIRCEDVPQGVEQPAGVHLPAWLQRQRWLAAHTDDQLLTARLISAQDLIRARFDLHDADGWELARTELRLSHGMRWEIEADEAIAGLVGACNGVTPLGFLVELLAMSNEARLPDVTAAVLPAVRDLIGRGVLEPVGGS